MSTADVSVVVPVFNEEATIGEFHRRLTAVMRSAGVSYEVVLVDDGSRDGSWDLLTRLQEAHPEVVAVRLSRNFGQQVAVTAGMDISRGARVVLIDADLQEQPEDIPRLLARLDEGFDVAYGVRDPAHDSWFRRFASRAFWAVLTSMSHYPIPAHQTMLRAMTRRFVTQFQRLPERARFIAGMMAWMGYPQVSVVVAHAPRAKGSSGYTLRRMVLTALHGITAFSFVPLQAASVVGVTMATTSLLLAFYWILRKLVWGIAVQGWASLMVTVLFIGGIQILMMGIFGEYLARVYAESQQRPLYMIDCVRGRPDHS